DSILIDEARTPLIISGSADQIDQALYHSVNDIIPYLRRDEDYLVDEEHRAVSLTDAGIEAVEERLKIENLYDPSNIEVVHRLTKALQAHTLYQKDVNYMVRGGEVVIVDEFTGRAMEGRRWSDGLHQAVEAKEGVIIQQENQTLATVTFQNFFRMYDKLAGMTGTAETEAEEFYKTYELNTLVIPTNRPIARRDFDDLIYRSMREKFNAIADQIEACHERGQPTLVGTTSVEKSEALSKILNKRKIPHEVLNAKYHEREAQIVAQAGRRGAVTIATNMAGRGTDIMLGGNPDAMTELELGKPDLPDGIPEMEIEEHLPAEYLAKLEEYRAQCAEEKQEVLASGGLYIIGSERHESRRIDNQLRGRSGRQGDPGASKFFLSLEDDLLRLFGSERIAKVMDALKMEEGVPIEAPMVTRSIENAQKKVEGRNYEIRKNLLEYDDVMDLQRKTVYALRRSVLKGQDERERSLAKMTLDLFEEVALATINAYANTQVRPEDWDLDAMINAIERTFNISVPLKDVHGRDAIESLVWEAVSSVFYETRERFIELGTQNEEALQREREDLGIRFGEEDTPKLDLFQEQIQVHYLRTIDRKWRGHLLAMDQLRDSINLQGYAQKDPKKEYKKQGFGLFRDMMMGIKTEVVEYVSKVEPESIKQLLPALSAQSAPKQVEFNRGGVQTGDAAAANGGDWAQAPVALPKVGRNDPCPCGSGKKYKNCHLRTKNPRRARAT
ncbi:MAG: preprotein translocase subunit SecA, partial [Myxococcota bacterium]